MKTVYEVTKISGVSRRTLQYYDEIGLLKPDAVKPSGYRLYSEENLARLWRILFYRDLNFSLEEIKKTLDTPPETEQKLMREHRRLLLEKRDRLEDTIRSIDSILAGGFETSMLKNFDTRSFQAVKKQNQKLAERRLVEGDPFYDFLRPLIEYKLTSRVGVSSMIRNIRNPSILDWEKVRLEGEPHGQRFVAAMAHGPKSLQAVHAVDQFQQYVSGHLSACDANVMTQIADLYLKCAPSVNKTRAGLAQFVSDAIRHFYNQA